MGRKVEDGIYSLQGWGSGGRFCTLDPKPYCFSDKNNPPPQSRLRVWSMDGDQNNEPRGPGGGR